MNILQINSSVSGEQSHSSRLASEFSTRLRELHRGAEFRLRDLSAQPRPVLDGQALQARCTPPAERNADQQARVALDDALIAELNAADVLVIGVPMYNFGISAQLKNWIDAIAKAGVTFRYTANGPEGLLRGKKVYFLLSRGGVYRNTPNDTQVPYLTSFFGFLGLTDVAFIYAEGLSLGAEAEASALASAREQMTQLLAAA